MKTTDRNSSVQRNVSFLIKSQATFKASIKLKALLVVAVSGDCIIGDLVEEERERGIKYCHHHTANDH
jgi:hypothetical protein